MFERFTERARLVVVLAQQESRELGHDHIGTEHLLLGLLRESEGIAARALESCGLTLTGVRDDVVRRVPAPERSPAQTIPFTSRAKHVLELALREALGLGQNFIETEHMLLALVNVDGATGAAVLNDCGVDVDVVRARVSSMLPRETPEVRRSSPPEQPSRTIAARLLPADVRAFLAEVAQEIRDQLGREPDTADYWLALASVPGSLGARVLSELGIDAASLGHAIDRARFDGGSPLGELTPDQAARHARLLFGLSSPD